jgi:hypothetical protein
MKANPEIVVNVNMSLRDYFAAKAMQGLVSAHNQEGIWTGCGDETSNRIMSETAYEIADAMIEARKTKNNPE